MKLPLALVLTPALFAQELPPGKAKPLVQRACTTCHELVIGAKQRMDRERWTAVVEDMVDRGARLSEEEIGQVVDYFVEHFGPAKSASGKVNVNRAPAETLVKELGISASEAGAIVQYREKNGPYRDIAGLKKAPGLDPAKVDALKDRLEF